MRLRASDFGVAIAVLLLTIATSCAFAQLPPGCTVSVLNRTVQVGADGSWVLPNVPANFGPVRARATCVQNGVTTAGESEPFTLAANGVINLPKIQLGQTTPIPTALALTAPTNTLTAIGQTTPLTVTAVYSNNTTKDVTAASNFTQYTVSNPAIATVSADGLVQAIKAGTVIIQATHEGASGMAALNVVIPSADSDGDGIPDDYELANGMNPNNPIDAQEDFDRDGLTNLREYQLGTDPRNPDTDGDGLKDGDEVARGTNPLLRDTDGDGISDGLEVQSGSNPLDPTSINLGAALSALTVAPPNVVLTVNTVISEASRQLVVTGTLRDGTQIDLTSTARGTNYASSDLSVCNFGAPDGMVFAGSAGSCTVTVSNNGFSATVGVEVRIFSPVTLGFVSIPGFANNVDVSGDFAYVAAGAAGLQVVDVSDRSAPRVVAALDTPGSANDVKVVGNTAFVADGTAGLRIVDIADPRAPRSVGAVDTPGDAQDVVVRGNLAFVADGSAGLQVINVSDPSAPVIIGGVATSGAAQGVDAHLERQVAVVAVGTAGIRVVDISDIARPVVVGSIDTGNALDVALSADGNTVFVADLESSLTVVDVTSPAFPVRRASTPRDTGGLLTDVALSGRFAMGADVFFVNGVPIVDVSDPSTPRPRAILDFRNFRDDNGTGIAVDGSYVYLTAAVGSDSRLYIGQYLEREDRAGIPPTVAITAPATGSTVVEGERVPVSVSATDDVSVVAVDLIADGRVAATDTSAPYEFTVTAPNGVSRLTLGASALDLGSNVGVAGDVILNVIPDPLTTVVGVVVDSQNRPVQGATVTISGGLFAITDPNGVFVIQGVPTISQILSASVSIIRDNTQLSGRSGGFSAVRAGTTDLGTITIREGLVLEGLVAYWPFDDGANPTEDLVGGHHVDLASAMFNSTDTVPLPGNVSALSFPNVGDHAVARDPSAFNFASTSSMSIALWLKQTTVRGVFHVFGKRAGCGSNFEYQLARDSRLVAFGSGTMAVFLNDDFLLNQWTHVAITYDGAAGQIKMYVNGSLAASRSNFVLSASSSAPLQLATSGTCPASQTFPGLLDDFRVYSRAITPDEVAALVGAARSDWTPKAFPSVLGGNWFSDFDGSFQWAITAPTTIRTWNRFFAVQTTDFRQPGEYRVIATEGNRWYPFFFRTITAGHMEATFPGCATSLDGFATQAEALQASPVYKDFCKGNHR